MEQQQQEPTILTVCGSINDTHLLDVLRKFKEAGNNLAIAIAQEFEETDVPRNRFEDALLLPLAEIQKVRVATFRGKQRYQKHFKKRKK